MRNTAHIINHTHWDREWFLTSIYTNQWLPGLVDQVEQLAANNPDYRFFLDGQTLIVEDLINLSPEYEQTIHRLARNGNLVIGPYYCQPDWRLTSGELLLRNLLYGRQDMERYGGDVNVGWLVDTFGHISQTPQLHRLFGLQAVFVWRGVPQLEPYITWEGADGHSVFAINLFGGYRNLYGVTHVPEVAIQRLQTEIRKLQPFYPTADIPLFDGYDLENNPEDPLRFFRRRWSKISPDLQLRESTPQDFALRVSQKLKKPPVLRGELNSGKYGAVFPGTLSTRTYLKVMSRDCEYLLYQVCEPLGVMARLKGRPYPAQQYEAWGRALLQNAVHDCICGVSVDQVHEKMEFSYRQVFEAIKMDIRDSLACILHDFAPGTYAVSTNPFPYEGWQVVCDRLFPIKTDGIGIWVAEESISTEMLDVPIETFTWQNSHYSASLREDGVVQVGAATLGFLTISEERGDTYSDEIGLHHSICLPQEEIVIEQKSDRHCVLRILYALSWTDIHISATVRLIFDHSPLIRWQVELDSRGTDFRVEVVFKTAHTGQVYSGMPFDTVQRPTVDRDLLPRQPEEYLNKVLLGQREIGSVKTFPFHDFIAISGEESSAVILTRGLHAYHADDDGCITIPLRRAVEWLTKSDLEYRVGDAGPSFYVPDARCERKVTHELAVMIVNFGVDDPQLHALNAGFQNPPLLIESQGTGKNTQWQLLREDIPLSSLHILNDRILARFSNPTTHLCSFSRPGVKTDVFGNLETTTEIAPPKSITTIAIEAPLPAANWIASEEPRSPANEPIWRVGPNHGSPDPKVIQQLKDRIAQLQGQIAEIATELGQSEGRARYILQHQSHVLEREQLEYRLSVALNELKMAAQEHLQYEYLFEPNEEVAAIGWLLNQLRIKRRIYDYIVQAV